MVALVLLIVVTAWVMSLPGWAKGLLIVALLLGALVGMAQALDDLRTGRRWAPADGPPVLRIVSYGFWGLLLLALLVRVATGAAAATAV